MNKRSTATLPKPGCPRCRHLGYRKSEAANGRPLYTCDGCGSWWTDGPTGGRYAGHEMPEPAAITADKAENKAADNKEHPSMKQYQANLGTHIHDVGDQAVHELAYRIAGNITPPAQPVDIFAVKRVSDVLIRVYESGYTAGFTAGQQAASREQTP